MELTKEEIQERKELKYKLWEAKVERNKRLTETLDEIGWGGKEAKKEHRGKKKNKIWKIKKNQIENTRSGGNRRS